MTQMCGDATCESRACSLEALDEWEAQQEETARIVVREALGLPLDA